MLLDELLWVTRKIDCPDCEGGTREGEIPCLKCEGTGYDPTEDNPSAQCHVCYGTGLEEIDTCPTCGGSGKVEVEYPIDPIGPKEQLPNGRYACIKCGEPATYVLVDYYHRILEGGIFFCSECVSEYVFEGELQYCDRCKRTNYYIELGEHEYLPIYPIGALNRIGDCSEHSDYY